MVELSAHRSDLSSDIDVYASDHGSLKSPWNNFFACFAAYYARARPQRSVPSLSHTRSKNHQQSEVEETYERVKVQPGVEGYVICNKSGQVLGSCNGAGDGRGVRIYRWL